jgi:hypothetical protein
LRNLTTEVIRHGRITTTLHRAKAVRGEVDRMIGLAKVLTLLALLVHHTAVCVSAYCGVCVLILVCMCRGVAAFRSVCVLILHSYICVLVLLYMHCYICVLLLLYACAHTAIHMEEGMARSLPRAAASFCTSKASKLSTSFCTSKARKLSTFAFFFLMCRMARSMPAVKRSTGCLIRVLCTRSSSRPPLGISIIV